MIQTKVAGIAQLVERYLAKVQVAGSNPVSRSNFTNFTWLYILVILRFVKAMGSY